ncbi:hypothetical protein SERLA73DRAFT_175318 [Serpula lacrymans var. lacrymans S7.3]|uniref:Uncharacterized protein n=2 Tax=Serpula lacrymans var. lacrymans TaxID=341189 RepID=F8PJ93_SERL3|nr:uncharacterized protein SERLADRAFT_457522 [Serpula lacrymans var. lacrymans S7.9]EGO03718.1 hypothetical protein SERLA73DRAFT_175318 [Serpula lacrymans var. lacrymans S7.3]EGO29581.1 hypothetical protein SERLADRAFT_457522 [Serpula lacrymans var. lacrymans S7.9]
MWVVMIQGVPPTGDSEHLAGLWVKVKNGIASVDYHGLDQMPPGSSSLLRTKCLTKSEGSSSLFKETYPKTSSRM